MYDVAIIGVGIHPFGRFGDKSAIDMGAEAARAALTDAGVTWPQVQFAFGGSREVDNPDAVVGLLGCTGIPFMDVYNGCATAATALQLTADGIRSGNYEIGMAVGMDKHDAGAFTADPVHYGAPPWYGDVGHFLTTKFFGMKINRYMHDYGISHETLAQVAAKAYRNGELNPNAFRRKPIAADEILSSRMLNYPLTQYMFCAPNEGAAAAVLCRADLVEQYTSRTPIFLRATALRTRRYGAFEVHSSWAAVDQDDAPTVYASKAAYEEAALGPDDVDVVQLQDTDAGAEVIHLAENGFCEDGAQEQLVADGAFEIGGALPVNTDGGLIANGEPIGASGLRQIHELVLQLRGEAGDRQVPGSPRVGYAQLYGAPGTAGVSIVTT
ncbi:MAG TPA: thiolase family protein [Acidimicrobiales bacterium]|jgi:acetyl-CoA acetyltransferase|nr:thiolase family protein [Acidimicrobiales bacterium]